MWIVVLIKYSRTLRLCYEIRTYMGTVKERKISEDYAYKVYHSMS